MENSRQKITELGLILTEEYTSLTLHELKTVAKAFAKRLKGGETVLFFGDLGCGKTTFIRSMMEYFNVDPNEVRSPTFNIVNTYQADGKVVYHIDVYRITADELFELGFYDYQEQNSILLIEWAEKIVDEIDQPDYLICLSINGGNMSTRDLQIYTGSDR
jgi:tRNA threonylcarbamoyladenosine biosynthesis protein TsaE